MMHTSKAAALGTHAANRVHGSHLSCRVSHFYCTKSSTFIVFLRRCLLSKRNACVVLVLGHIGVNVHTFAPVYAFQNNAIYSENYTQSTPFKWLNGWQTSTFASLQRRNNVASVDYNHPQHIRSYLENSTTCAAALPPSRGCRQGLLVPPSVEMRLRALSLDRMARLYAKCFA